MSVLFPRVQHPHYYYTYHRCICIVDVPEGKTLGQGYTHHFVIILAFPVQ